MGRMTATHGHGGSGAPPLPGPGTPSFVAESAPISATNPSFSLPTETLQAARSAQTKVGPSDSAKEEDRPLSTAASGRKHAKGANFSLTPPTQRWVVPVKNWTRWMMRMELGRYILPCIVLGSLLIKFSVGLWGWSGRGIPPRYGDFEAQRHWIELTLHKPYSEWYTYDLDWWGLDYPPLTAWVSLWLGKLATRTPSVAPHFALDTSRGDESDAVVAFMRFSVVLCDLAVYIPAVIFFCYARRMRDRPFTAPAVNAILGGPARRLGPLQYNLVIKGISAAAILTQPALLLIDHGHFQYNCVMLGLCAWSFALLYSFLPNHASKTTFFDSAGNTIDTSGTNTASVNFTYRSLYTRKISYQYVVAAVTFTLALLFKQMALFYAPAIFAVMLGRCIGLYRTVGFDPAFALFCGLGIAVISPTILSLIPWLIQGDLAGLIQIAHRVFPVARGIFEDKVANVWCLLSVLPLIPRSLRVKNVFPASILARMAAGTTFLLIVPTCVVLFLASKLTVEIETEIDTQAAEAASKPMPSPPKSRYAFSQGQRSMRSRASKKSLAKRAHAWAYEGGVESSRAESQSGRGYTAGPSGRLHVEPSSSRPSLTSPLQPDSSATGVTAESSAGEHWASATRPPERVSSSPSPVAAVLPWGTAHVALTCFLFGFQVHEKTILLPLLPVVLCLTSPDDNWGAGAAANEAEWGMLFNNTAMFSMYPLLQRDGLAMPYFLLTLGWNWMLGMSPRTHIRRCLALLQDITGLTLAKGVHVRTEINLTWAQRFSTLAHTSMVALHVLSWAVPKLGQRLLPGLATRLAQRYPDVEPVAIVALTVPILGTLWLVLLWKTLTVASSAGVRLPYLNPAPRRRPPPPPGPIALLPSTPGVPVPQPVETPATPSTTVTRY